MRHRAKRHSFHRRYGPRLALVRGLVNALVLNGRIKTTVVRAKEIRRHVEKAITLGKSGSLHSRRLLMSRLGNLDAVENLMDDVAKRFKKRQGGYTRIIKIGPRPGDQADMALIEFVDYTPPEAKSAETVTGDKDLAQRQKAKARRVHAARKNRRMMQSESRHFNRA